jgi:hypothetical protein
MQIHVHGQLHEITGRDSAGSLGPSIFFLRVSAVQSGLSVATIGRISGFSYCMLSLPEDVMN